MNNKKDIYDCVPNKIFYEEYHVTEEDVIAGLCENEKIRELIYQK